CSRLARIVFCWQAGRNQKGGGCLMLRLKAGNGLLIFGLTLIIALGATPWTRAQSTAGLRGTVVDAQGSVVPDAVVTVRNTQTGVEYPSHTDSSGIFEYPTLPPGSYHVEISHPGFQKLSVDGLVLEVDSVVAQK